MYVLESEKRREEKSIDTWRSHKEITSMDYMGSVMSVFYYQVVYQTYFMLTT